MLQKILKLDLILQIMNKNAIPLIDQFLKEKIKSNWINERQKSHDKICWIKRKNL